MEMGPASPPDESLLGPMLPEATWVTPVPDARVAPESADPAEIAQYRESIRLAFVTALQHLPARQRAALILCEVLRWQVAEVAELLDTSVAAVNSALQRARATLRALPSEPRPEALDDADAELLERYVDAFERYDIERLVTLLHEDAVQSMPPFAMWLRGAADIGRWMVEPGPSGCRGSRLVPTSANGCPAFGQYRPDPAGGYAPWALQVLEISEGKITGMSVLPGLLGPRAALPRVRPAPPPRRVGRPARGALAAPGETSARTIATPEAPGQQRQAGHVVHRAEVRGARSLEHAAGQLGAVGADDHDPAPQLDGSHHMVDGRWPAISSAVTARVPQDGEVDRPVPSQPGAVARLGRPMSSCTGPSKQLNDPTDQEEQP